MKDSSLYFTEIQSVFSSGMNCGIKPEKLDLCYFYIPNCFSTSAVFTKNKFCADSVNFTRDNIGKNPLKAFIVNSGNANAVTKTAREANNEIAKCVSSLLNIKESEVGIASTGIIGVELDHKKITTSLSNTLTNPKKNDGNLAAKAILTTDLVEKSVHIEKEIAGKKIIISGISKGSGMIAPNMATMLAFVFTNIKVPKNILDEFLINAVNDSFNMISVDTDTSTNDMLVAFSAEEEELDFSDAKIKKEFYDLFLKVNIELAKKIVEDGEGATKLIEAEVINSENKEEAKKIAKSIIDSPLVKTAIHGEDPNWGRIAMAIGKIEDTNINPQLVDIYIQETLIFSKGFPVSFDTNQLKNKLKDKLIVIKVDLSNGCATSKAWGCDLTHGYIDINVDYN